MSEAAPRVNASASLVEAQAFLEASRTLILFGRDAAGIPAGRFEGALHGNLGRIALPVQGLPLRGGDRFAALLQLPPMPAQQIRALEVAPERLIPFAPSCRALPPEEGLERARRALREAPADARTAAEPLLPRRSFSGTDTLPRLAASAVHLAVDRALRLGGKGMLLTGWLLDPGKQLAALRVCTEAESHPVDLSAAAVIPRPDVREAAGVAFALDHDDWGFSAFVPLCPAPDETCWIEVELRDGEVGQRALAPVEGAGLAVIRQVLATPRAAPSRLAAVMSGTIGPAVEALNEARLQRPRDATEITYGTLPEAPRVSVVVPLHGRVDFMEFQLALFSAAPDPEAELIYVLDDPRRRAETEALALSAHARFGLPFRLVLLEENWGFAPACNEGARRARGRHLCMLNSDVFPQLGEGMGFLAALSARLDADPTLGAVAPLLLFEDGTVQHQGMRFEAVRGLPPWPFPIHERKAHPAPEGAGLIAAPALTGACLVLRREDWDVLGGFDEGFVIGDFEDADLCLRLRERGLGCAVDPAPRLFHLERQSQEEGAGWRFHATLFNAWRHDRRWGAKLAS